MHKNLIFWLIIILTGLFIWQSWSSQRPKTDSISYSKFVTAVDSGEVANVTMKKGNTIVGKYVNGTPFQTFVPDDPDLVKMLRDKGIEITAESVKESIWSSLLITGLPILVIIGLWIFFIRQMQVGGGKAMSFGKSRARVFLKDQGKKVTFKDVAGIEESMRK